MTDRDRFPGDDSGGGDSDDANGDDDDSIGPGEHEPPFRGPTLDETTAEAVLEEAVYGTGASRDGEIREEVGDESNSDSRFGSEPESESNSELGSAPEPESEPEPELEPEPEEALSQPLVDERDLGATERAELREAYGRVRAFFKDRSERYRGLQRRLQQARVRDTYDEYLTTSVTVAVVAALVAGLVTAVVLVAVTIVAEPVVLEPLVGDAGWGQDVLLTNPLVVAALTVPLVVSLATGATAWIVRNYYYPRSVVAARRRSIALNMPYAITFMYALTSGGMNFIEVCRRLGNSEEVYGEVANEFDLVVREIDLFGNDLLQALDNVQTLTPSEGLRQFLDDLLGVLESGGDLETFLEAESREALDDALDEQESFIGTLGALSEVFVVAFIAAPLFLIVVLMVVSFLGADTVGVIAALVYVVFPLSMIGFLLVVDLLSRPYEVPTTSLTVEEERTIETEAVADDPRFAAYWRSKQETGLRAFLSDPFRAIRRRPVLSLWLTVPAGIGVAGLAVWAGFVEASLTSFFTTPLRTTVGLVVVPLVTATGPLMVLHERERRRTQVITERFPDVLNILASANRMGVDLVDGFELVTRWASGTLAEELEKVRNDVAWNHDVTGALLAFADRLNVPQLTRTMTLVAEGTRSSGDLHGLLAIAAANTKAHAKLTRARRREVGSYVAIVVVGFLVYLLVIIMVSASYLGPIGELTVDSGPTAVESPVTLGSIPVETYQLLFLHSALVQGFGSGLIAGKLAENDVLSGLKYGLGLVVLTVVAFFLLV